MLTVWVADLVPEAIDPAMGIQTTSLSRTVHRRAGLVPASLPRVSLSPAILTELSLTGAVELPV